MRPRRALALPALAVLWAAPALAETHAVVAAGGGLPAVDVRVDLAAATVVAGGARVPIGLDRARLPAERDVVVQAVAIGAGRRVVHVRVPAADADGVAWEALLAPGRADPIFAGLTGFVAGDPGERTGQAVRIVEGDASSFVLVGDVREDLRLCGQNMTLLEPRALYPASLDLRPATVQRLDAGQLASAQPIVAADHGPKLDPALSRLLVARGSSVPGSRGAELTDGDPSTVWTERRPGMGQGEFVVMAAPLEVPVTRVQFVLSPPSPDAASAAPRTFYLATGEVTFEITVPGDAWRKPGEAYEVVFPKPVAASCMALVLSDAYTRGLPHPEVGVAELVAYGELDAPGATLDDVAAQLSGERGVVAAQVLERAGQAALGAVERAYDRLDARGKALAVDVAASHERCEQAAPLLSRGLCEAGGEAPRKAREKLERCKGAAGALASRVRSDAASRACLAPTLVAIAGAEALAPIADALADSGVADTAGRAALRRAFSLALDPAPPGRLAQLLGETRAGASARLELLRAAGPRIVEAAALAAQILGEVLGPTATMRERYLALGPLGELARAGQPAAAARLAAAITGDPEGPVRTRAAEVAGGVEAALPSLLAATRDAEPRVREAALASLSASRTMAIAEAARAVLAGDRWSFVKVQAVGALASSPPSEPVDASLAAALVDPSSRVRGAALLSLGRRRASSTRGAVRQRLDDRAEDVDVRATAARVLGALCDSSSADRLTGLAWRLGAAGAEEEEQQLALAALEGLAALQPADLAERLRPLTDKATSPGARAAAQRALGARGACAVGGDAGATSR